MQRKIIVAGQPFLYEYEAKKVKNMNLRVRRDGTVHVSAPRFVPVSRTDAFVLAHMPLIARARERLAQKKRAEEEREQTLFYRGVSYPLAFAPGKRRLALRADGATLFCAAPTDAEKCRRALEACVRELFYPVLLAACRRADGLFAARGVSPPKEIRLRKMKSMWGNCRPGEGILTFSTMLTAVEAAELDYVVFHEYTHFLHPDHSAAFYRALAEVCPDWRARRHALRHAGAGTGKNKV